MSDGAPSLRMYQVSPGHRFCFAMLLVVSLDRGIAYRLVFSFFIENQCLGEVWIDTQVTTLKKISDTPLTWHALWLVEKKRLE